MNTSRDASMFSCDIVDRSEQEWSRDCAYRRHTLGINDRHSIKTLRKGNLRGFYIKDAWLFDISLERTAD
jgi:hypothetical protein